MNEDKVQSFAMQKPTLRSQAPSVDDLELMHMYLSGTAKQRSEQFADTARTAEITGLSRRTILLWIQLGLLRAVRVGKKHQVSLVSLREYLIRIAEK